MEEKNLDADQRIELIQQMIRGTRQRLSFGSSNLFLLWGYLLAATAIVIFVLLKTTDCRTWLWLWLPAAATGGAVTWWHNRFRAPAAGTDMELHSLTGRPVGDPDLRVRPVGGRPALPCAAADRRRTLHLGAGNPQQVHVLRIMRRNTDRLRYYPGLLAQCRPRLQPAAIRRSGSHRAHGCRLRAQKAGKVRCGQSGEIKRRA